MAGRTGITPVRPGFQALTGRLRTHFSTSMMTKAAMETPTILSQGRRAMGALPKPEYRWREPNPFPGALGFVPDP